MMSVNVFDDDDVSFCVFVYGVLWLKPSILRCHNDVYRNPFKFL
jgi:hypothetical protein